MANTFTLIEAKTLGSAVNSVTFSSIPQTFTDLQLLMSPRNSESGPQANYYLQFNSDSGANYANRRIYGLNGTVYSDTGNTSINGISAGFINANTSDSNTFSNCSSYIPNYTNTSYYKSVSTDYVAPNNGTYFLGLSAGLWNNTNAITSLTVIVNIYNLMANSTFYLYGISNS
jgi:hypothetical protein